MRTRLEGAGRRGSLLIPIVLVLLPAAVLVSVGVSGLSRALRGAEDEARLGAERDALALARGLRGAVADPRVLDLIDPVHGFRLNGGRLVVPEEVGWIVAPPPESTARELSRALRDDLDRAARAEFGSGEGRAKAPAARAAVAAIHDDILQDPFVRGRDRPYAQLAAAWSAHRLGNVRRRDELLDELELLAGAGAPMYRDTVAGAAVLGAAADRPTHKAIAGRLCALPPAEARVVLTRMREVNGDPMSIDALERRLAGVETQRAALRRASAHRATLIGAQAPLHRLAGERLLLYYPHADGRGGAGAVLAPRELFERLRAAAVSGDQANDSMNPTDGAADELAALVGLSAGAWSSRPVYGEPIAADATPVLPGLGVLPAQPEGATLFASAWVPMALIAVTALTLVVGLALSGRALRREHAAMAVRDEFLVSVTHELKTPLASIQLLGEMLLDDRAPDGAARERYHQRLLAETGRLRMIVENVLDLGRSERSETSYNRGAVDLADVLREALRVFAPLAERDDVVLSLDATGLPSLEAGERAVVLGDREALLQVFLNLLENARRHARDGRSVRLSIDTADDNWLVRVRDRGPGVPPEERDSIFRKFSRGGRAVASGNPGVGLGLFLARRVLQDHGGDLRHEEPRDGGPGACFVATLPALRDEDDAMRRPSATANGSKNAIAEQSRAANEGRP